MQWTLSWYHMAHSMYAADTQRMQAVVKAQRFTIQQKPAEAVKELDKAGLQWPRMVRSFDAVKIATMPCMPALAGAPCKEDVLAILPQLLNNT